MQAVQLMLSIEIVAEQRQRLFCVLTPSIGMGHYKNSLKGANANERENCESQRPSCYLHTSDWVIHSWEFNELPLSGNKHSRKALDSSEKWLRANISRGKVHGDHLSALWLDSFSLENIVYD